MSNADRIVDVLIVGSGGAGLTAAITARLYGLEVLVIEKETEFGGTTAVSGGEIWIPCNRQSLKLAKENGTSDSLDDCRIYLRTVIAERYDAERIDAYLNAGPEMVEFLRQRTEVQFEAVAGPDYYPELPGASDFRALAPVPLTARRVGWIGTMRGALPQTLLAGLALGSSAELRKFLTASRSISSLAYVIGRMGRHFAECAIFGRGQRLVRGQALIGRLAMTCEALKIPILLQAPAQSLLFEGGRVAGAVVGLQSGPITVSARAGVILASGGYPRDVERRLRSHPPGADQPVVPVPMGNTGDGARLAESVGGRFDGSMAQAAAWTPTSMRNGSTRFSDVWPHLVDRNQPGFVMVLSDGKRFVNEGTNYHDVVAAMLREFAARGADKAWLVADRRAVRKWGIGFVRPFPFPIGKHVASGYLLEGRTVEALAGKMQVDATALAETLREFNEYAATGIDRAFSRGASAYDRAYTFGTRGPNTSLGRLDKAPFYAVRIYPGEIGSFNGLDCDADARVLDAAKKPLPGLYAVGNDQASVFKGTYPGAGATIGPGMVFGWLAARHLIRLAGKRPPGGG